MVLFNNAWIGFEQKYVVDLTVFVCTQLTRQLITDAVVHEQGFQKLEQDPHPYTCKLGGHPGWGLGVIGSDIVDLGFAYFSLILRNKYFSQNIKMPNIQNIQNIYKKKRDIYTSTFKINNICNNMV